MLIDSFNPEQQARLFDDIRETNPEITESQLTALGYKNPSLENEAK